MIAPPAICNGVIASPSTPQASSAENGGSARMTTATRLTGTRPTATEVKPCPIACETTPSNTTIDQPSGVEGIIFSPCKDAAIVSATAETAADQSVAVAPSRPERTVLMNMR